MRKRREIAGCAHRTLRRNAWHHAGGEQRFERLDDVVTNTRIAARERRDLERNNEPNHGVVQQGSGSGGVRYAEHWRAAFGGQLGMLSDADVGGSRAAQRWRSRIVTSAAGAA